MPWLSRILALPKDHPNNWLVTALGLCVLLAVGLAVATEELPILLLPVGILVVFTLITDFKQLFFLLFLCIPLSVEVELPGGLGTDLPTEPLMWLLMGTSFVYVLHHWRTLDTSFLRHPLSLVLLAHLTWTLVAVLLSQDFVVSLKFFLAKIWYVIVLYFFAGYVIKTEKDLIKLVWAVAVPLVLVIIFASIKHALEGFSFEASNTVAWPFFRNHVAYACLPAVFLPYLFYQRKAIKKGTAWRWFLSFAMFWCLFAINFAFTRAAYVAIVAAVGVYFLVRIRAMRPTLLVVVAIMALFIGYLSQRDTYLYYAPNFERTIAHKRFDNLLEATTKLEDISTMERVYRWVAAAQMVEERPLTGWGPGTFYFFYKNFTVSSFRTYVSDNPERSGIHCYYLMVLVEQGILGFLFFMALVFGALLLMEKNYHDSHDPAHRRMTLAAGLSFFMICLLMLMNDFVETDKLGSFFFLALAILVRLSLPKGKNESVKNC